MYTRRRTARKPHECGCGETVPPGDVYLVHTTYPGADSGFADAAGRPVRLKECAMCACRYGRDHQVEPMLVDQAARVYDRLAREGMPDRKSVV